MITVRVSSSLRSPPIALLLILFLLLPGLAAAVAATDKDWNRYAGWQLGERGEWDKQTNFDAATRVPLLIKVPWKPQSQGQRTASLTDLVDMHPTVAALAGIPTTLPWAFPVRKTHPTTPL